MIKLILTQWLIRYAVVRLNRRHLRAWIDDDGALVLNFRNTTNEVRQ